MYDELLAELTAMNGNAKALLEKYDNAGVKLDAKLEELLTAITDAYTSGLNNIRQLLDSGNVAQAENALKLENKSLNDLKIKCHTASNIIKDAITTNTPQTWEIDLSGYGVSDKTQMVFLNIDRYMSHDGNYHSYLNLELYQKGNEANKIVYNGNTFQNYANRLNTFKAIAFPNDNTKLIVKVTYAFNDNSSSYQRILLEGRLDHV